VVLPCRFGPCPFCSISADQVWIDTEHAVAFHDAFPVADGHTLVAPRKHVSTIYELTISEQRAIWDLVGEVRERLLTGLRPNSFSIGFNDEPNGAGDGHVAVHVVPRRRHDALQLRRDIKWISDADILALRR
jgi:diadenosine tetraphosphate (Ap4A) HIT family hydrolase